MTAVPAEPAAEPDVLSRLPAALWRVPYRGSRFPGTGGVAEGANCQLYAYAVLRHFGLAPPSLRSRELWQDTAATVRVATPRPLDLLLFNTTAEAYGAHLGVWVGDDGDGDGDGDTVLHLCAEVGRPAVWGLAKFAARERYRVLVGVKRVIRRLG